MPCHVQAPLDCSERNVELLTHLPKGATAEVKGFEHLAIKGLQMAQPLVDFSLFLSAHDFIEWTFAVIGQKGLAQMIEAAEVPPTIQTIQRESNRDLTEP